MTLALSFDADLRSIYRKRRREKRCLKCGQPVPRAALCKACRQTHAYCPTCERVLPWECFPNHQRSTQNGRATDYCHACHNAYQREKRGITRDRAAYLRDLAARTAQPHPLLKQIIALYRRELSLDAIAAELGISRSQVGNIIHVARQRGQWPKTLRRIQRRSAGTSRRWKEAA